MHIMETQLIYIQESVAAKETAQAYISRCQDVRRSVFVEGQGVAEEIDFDGKDVSCAHLLLLLEGGRHLENSEDRRGYQARTYSRP